MIVTVLIVGWIQLSTHRIQRTEANAKNLMQTLYRRDLARSISPDSNVFEEVLEGVDLSGRGRRFFEGWFPGRSIYNPVGRFAKRPSFGEKNHPPPAFVPPSTGILCPVM